MRFYFNTTNDIKCKTHEMMLFYQYFLCEIKRTAETYDLLKNYFININSSSFSLIFTWLLSFLLVQNNSFCLLRLLHGPSPLFKFSATVVTNQVVLPFRRSPSRELKKKVSEKKKKLSQCAAWNSRVRRLKSETFVRLTPRVPHSALTIFFITDFSFRLALRTTPKTKDCS